MHAEREDHPALAELRRRLSEALSRERWDKTRLARRALLGRTTVQQAFQIDGPVPSEATVAALARVLRLPEDELLELRRTAVTERAGEEAAGPAPTVSMPSLGIRMPVYLVADTSESMAPYMDSLNEELLSLLETLLMHPILANMLSVSIVAFNTKGLLVMEMTDVQDIDHVPVLASAGECRYTPMLESMKGRISADLPVLAARGCRPIRPVAIILTNGHPVDKDWHMARSSLLDWSLHPHLVACGFGSSNADVVAALGNDGAFVPSGDSPLRGPITEILLAVSRQLIESTPSGRAFRIPDNVVGMRKIGKSPGP